VFSGSPPGEVAAYFRKAFPDGVEPDWFQDAVYDLLMERLVVHLNAAWDDGMRDQLYTEIQNRIRKHDGMEEAWKARIRVEDGRYVFTPRAPDNELVKTTKEVMRERMKESLARARENLKQFLKDNNLPDSTMSNLPPAQGDPSFRRIPDAPSAAVQR